MFLKNLEEKIDMIKIETKPSFKNLWRNVPLVISGGAFLALCVSSKASLICCMGGGATSIIVSFLLECKGV